MRNKKGQFIKGHTFNVGAKHTKEARLKMSEIAVGRKHTEETKKKMSFIKKGQIPWNKGLSYVGKLCSEETKMKIGNANRGKIKSKELCEEISRRMIGKKLHCQEHTQETKDKISRAKIGKKLSMEHRQKMSISMMGKNSKGGITPINAKIRTSLKFRLWREAIFSKDNWTCQKFYIRGGTLHPHHIQNFADFPELRFDVNNGVTLSKEAHIVFHKIYGKRNNTREQLEEFLCV